MESKRKIYHWILVVTACVNAAFTDPANMQVFNPNEIDSVTFALTDEARSQLSDEIFAEYNGPIVISFTETPDCCISAEIRAVRRPTIEEIYEFRDLFAQIMPKVEEIEKQQPEKHYEKIQIFIEELLKEFSQRVQISALIIIIGTPSYHYRYCQSPEKTWIKCCCMSDPIGE